MASLDLVSVLQDLVRLPSVNPMGRVVQGDIYYEHRVTAYLETLFRNLGVRYERQTMAEGRDNIVARIDGDVPAESGAPLIMLEAHQDTVPVDHMVVPPFDPQVRDGRVYGRGSCDIKGGMASMLWAFARLAAMRPAGMPTVIMACTVNEEHGSEGAAKLAELWERPSAMFPRPPDAAIVAEPTLLNVVVAHKGVVRWRLRTHGRAAHSSQPQLGQNAIYAMGRVLSVIQRYASEVVPTLGSNRWVGSPTMSVGLIAGGISVNTVPDRCEIEVDRRVLPDESPMEALHHALRHFELNLTETVTHEPPFSMSHGLSDQLNGPLSLELGAIAKKKFQAGELIGVPFGTNAPRYAQTGVPTVVFGPGSIDQAHTVDEWVAIEQLEAAGETLYDFLVSRCK